MNPETTSISSQHCPTCGTRLTEGTKRCLVCGAEVGATEKTARASKAVQGSRMPEITLSLPAALGLLALFLTIGAVMVFFALREKPEVIVPMTPTMTATLTVTPTTTSTPEPPTPTNTPLPTPTPLTYVVKAGDSCAGIAGLFGVSVNSIVQLNNLSADCWLSEYDELKIPQPTPTVTPLPTSTLSVAEKTEQACTRETYVVQENDTPSEIASAYGVPWEAIKEENGLPGDMVYSGQPLSIPLCKRPTPQGPTPTPTSPPPYAAPNLLLPADGAPFSLADETVTLQWASVGTLRENERYAVTIVDVTSSEPPEVIYVEDTKYIVPSSFRPADRMAHILRWSVLTVRQVGTDKDGNPIYDAAGSASVQRTFSWSGVTPVESPQP